MKLKPINGRVLLKPLEVQEKTAGGIYIPDTAREKIHEGKIIDVPKDLTDEVVTGDIVVYKEYSGTEVKVDGEAYLLVTVDDLLAKYESVDEIPD